jgi:hypothetical protein
MASDNIESVLSWDIGVKNLSYCILERNKCNYEDQTLTKQGYFIKDWDLINLYEDEKEKINYCKEPLKTKGKICNRKGKYYEGDKYYCNKHKTDNSKAIKKPKKLKKSPFEYSKRIKVELDKRPELLNVNYVIIENQPSQLNPTMKSVQMLLFSYFSYKFNTNEAPSLISVVNVNAKQKEKLPVNDPDWIGSIYEQRVNDRYNRVKDRYKRRKILCLEYAKMCLENAPEYLSFLDNHSKQDDLTDCFLQATDYFIRND